MRVLPRLLVIALLAGVGCGTPTRRASLQSIAFLPRSEGMYGGKLLLPPPWLYLGGDERRHHFLYTYTRGNSSHGIRLLIAKSELELSFARPLSTDFRGIAVEPRYSETGEVLGFIESIHTRPEFWPWMNDYPPPNFDSPERINAGEVRAAP